ncbi:MAG TPA: tRNA adenosine(34) deaminase TadA [Candidatus Binataceae bacterium]|nr:tRNA adenosine(34) deaminase TadA [Candidatus Binataceae bacterium]
MIDRERKIELMALALAEARRGAAEGEVPVGAVVVSNDTEGAGAVVVAAAHNRPIALNDPTAHAEMLALRAAAAALGGYRLEGAALFVTLEPCVMCVGAMVHARIAELYFGARDAKAGALGSVYDIGRDGLLNHRIEVYGGLMEAECAALLRGFFRSRRSA